MDESIRIDIIDEAIKQFFEDEIIITNSTSIEETDHKKNNWLFSIPKRRVKISCIQKSNEITKNVEQVK